jgi:hypothetical protein
MNYVCVHAAQELAPLGYQCTGLLGTDFSIFRLHGTVPQVRTLSGKSTSLVYANDHLLVLFTGSAPAGIQSFRCRQASGTVMH